VFPVGILVGKFGGRARKANLREPAAPPILIVLSKSLRACLGNGEFKWMEEN
jgi:hypothetical protein